MSERRVFAGQAVEHLHLLPLPRVGQSDGLHFAHRRVQRGVGAGQVRNGAIFRSQTFEVSALLQGYRLIRQIGCFKY